MYGDRISYLREKNGLTQAQLAEKIGITRAALSHYEKNRREPPYEILQKLAEFFDVSIDWIIGRTDDPTPPKQTDNTDLKMDLRKAIMEKEITWGDRELPKESQEALRKIILAVLEREGII